MHNAEGAMVATRAGGSQTDTQGPTLGPHAPI